MEGTTATLRSSEPLRPCKQKQMEVTSKTMAKDKEASMKANGPPKGVDSIGNDNPY